jgi:hypothetical protein
VLASDTIPEHVPGTAVDRQCGSSQQAIHFAAQAVMSGVQDVVIAAGTYGFRLFCKCSFSIKNTAQCPVVVVCVVFSSMGLFFWFFFFCVSSELPRLTPISSISSASIPAAAVYTHTHPDPRDNSPRALLLLLRVHWRCPNLLSLLRQFQASST